MSPARVSRLVVVAGVAALALSACGGSSTSTTTAASAPTSHATGTSSPGSPSSSATASATSSSAVASAPSGLSADEYALRLVPLAERWQADAEHYGSLVSGSSTSLGTVSSASDAFVAATNRFADGIAALNPPRGAGVAQARLVAALRSLAGDVAELATAARNRDPAAAEQAEQSVGRDDTAVTNAVVALSTAARRSS